MGTSQRTSQRYLVFNGSTSGNANGSSQAYFCDDFQTAVLEVTATAGATLTLKIVGSNLSDVETTTVNPIPNFGIATSQANPWTYIQAIDLNDNSIITGATGISFAAPASDTTRKLQINASFLRWAGLEITGRSAGSVKATITFVDNR